MVKRRPCTYQILKMQVIEYDLCHSLCFLAYITENDLKKYKNILWKKDSHWEKFLKQIYSEIESLFGEILSIRNGKFQISEFNSCRIKLK